MDRFDAFFYFVTGLYGTSSLIWIAAGIKALIYGIWLAGLFIPIGIGMGFLGYKVYQINKQRKLP